MNRLKLFPRRTRIRLGVFCLFTLLTAGIFFGVTLQTARILRAESAQLRLRTLLQLSEYSAALTPALQKAAAISQPALFSEQMTAIAHSSACAKLCLDTLPGGAESYGQLYRFFSRCEQYALDLSKALAQGESADKASRDTLLRLRDLAQTVCNALCALTQDVLDGRILPAESSLRLKKTDTDSFARSLQSVGEILSQKIQAEQLPLFAEEKGATGSDLLKNLPDVTPASAAETAASLLGIEPVLLREEEAIQKPIACYRFYYQDVFISITRKGGLLLQLLNGSFAGESILSVETARNRAADFLKKLSYDSMREAYHTRQDGVCSFVFVYEKEGILFYPDQIRLDIALDSGDILNYDALSYIQNHREREIPAATFQKEALIEQASPNAQYRGLAVIERDGAMVLCHELFIPGENGGYLLYRNAQNGSEENLQLLSGY